MEARPGVHTPAVRHRAATMSRARELRAGGWSLDRICDHLEREGVRPVPSKATVSRWTAPPDVSQRYMRERRVRPETMTFAWPGLRGPEWRLGRMLRLREARLSYRAIAAVMAIDFPAEPMTEHQVRELLTAHAAAELEATG